MCQSTGICQLLGKRPLWGWHEGCRGWKSFGEECSFLRACLVAQMVKNLPAVQETQVRSLGQEDPLEKGMATHSSILGASLVAQIVKNLPAVWETWVRSPCWKGPLEKE